MNTLTLPIINKTSLLGRYFFAIAFVGIGIEHFIFQDFIAGRAPAWPQQIPGKLIWAYLTGLVFILISIAVITEKRTRLAIIFSTILIFIWALLRQIPLLFTDPFLSGKWTAAGKALTFIGGYLAVAAISAKLQFNSNKNLLRFINDSAKLILVARICLGVFFVVTGIQHFIYTEFVASLIPGWFPGNAVFWTYFAGVALIAGGIGLFIKQTTKIAAYFSGLMVFLWFWIVHIPRAFTTVSDGISVFEALAVSGIAFVIAGYLHQQES